MFAYVPSFLLQYVDFWEINWKFPRGCTATARRAWAQVASGIGVGGSNASASPRHPPFPLSAFPSSLNQPSEARGQKREETYSKRQKGKPRKIRGFLALCSPSVPLSCACCSYGARPFFVCCSPFVRPCSYGVRARALFVSRKVVRTAPNSAPCVLPSFGHRTRIRVRFGVSSETGGGTIH